MCFNAPLYRVLERLLPAFVPLFEAVITDASRGNRVHYPVSLYEVAGNLDDKDEDEDEDDDDDDATQFIMLSLVLPSWRHTVAPCATRNKKRKNRKNARTIDIRQG